MAAKSKFFALALWFATGLLGGHRFYLGSSTVGGLYVVLMLSLGYFAGEGYDNVADWVGTALVLLWLYDLYWVLSQRKPAEVPPAQAHEPPAADVTAETNSAPDNASSNAENVAQSAASKNELAQEPSSDQSLSVEVDEVKSEERDEPEEPTSPPQPFRVETLDDGDLMSALDKLGQDKKPD